MHILANDSSASDKWGKFGEVMGDVSRSVYFYILIIVILVILIAALIMAYFRKRKRPEGTGEDNRKNVPLRIVIYVLAGVLFLVIFPIIFINI